MSLHATVDVYYKGTHDRVVPVIVAAESVSQMSTGSRYLISTQVAQDLRNGQTYEVGDHKYVPIKVVPYAGGKTT